MPWYDNLIPDSIKKSVCSCLIKRYLSDFIENEITRDQLNLDLYNGRATAERIRLAVESLNELGEAQNWPIELVDGSIDKIHISIPWTSLFCNSTEIEICGLKLTVQPKQRNEDATSMFESMWNSMSSSMQLAQEIAKETSSKKQADNNQPIEGIELFAQTIDTVVKRIKIKLTDTTIQIEHLPKQSEKGVGLLVHIDCMEYYDDFSIECQDNQGTSDPSKEDTKKAYLVDSVTTKNVIISGIELSTVEFSSDGRTISRSLYKEDERESLNDNENVSDSDSDTDTPQPDDENSADRHVILCGKCFNNQEVKIRLKQSESINGPKIAIELNLGSLVLFLSPRQFHILAQLVDGFSSPHLEDNSNVFHKNSQPTRMTEKDFEKVEEQLIQMMAQKQYANLGLMQGGWSTGAMDESSDSEYIPAQAATSTMYDSTMSGCSSSMDSSITSSMVSSVTDASSNFRRRVSNIDSDPTAEISHFQVRFATFVGVLLHEDLLVQTSGNDKTLVWQMQSLAEQFFSVIDQSTFIGVSSDGFDLIHQTLEKGCNLNHLRLLASPLKLEGSETTTSSAFSMSGHLVASKLELLECLFNDSFKYIPLISFEPPLSANIPSNVRPNFSLKFKHVQKTGKSQYRRRGPKTEVTVNLDSCSVEFDLSIVDRISALLYHPTICTAQTNDPTPGLSAQQLSTGTSAKSVQDFKISCPLFKFKLRFPIPDFRPATDMSKPPWWERNVRPDYLTLVLCNASFRTIFQIDQCHNEYNVECKLLDIFYYENDRAAGMHIARCGLEEGPLVSMQNDAAFLTKLAIKIFPKSLGDEEILVPIDPMTHSYYGAFENQGNPDPGPFGAKRVVHKSDTPHDNVKKEEQVIPGDKSEMEAFVKSAMSNTQILVEVSLPLVSILLESKHMYELIYNRISNDLLLWQPQAPKPNISNNLIGQFENIAFDQQYILADSGLRNDSDSDDLSEDDLPSNVYYSAYGSKMKNTPHINTKTSVKKCSNGQCSFVMSLDIMEGIVSLNPPVRDSSSNVIPGQQGELALHINNGKVFIVSGYKGDDDLGYVSVQVDDAQLYHCDIQPTPSTSPPLREVGAPLNGHLVPTIYKSGKKSLLSESRAGARQMFTVAIKIQANHETHHVKVITVSLGLNRATLRHKIGSQSNSWISHLIDFFNVHDDPIPGYIPKDVLTELHLHIWDCLIDYRPLYLPLRSVVTIGSFSLSSHLTAVANTSTLTMIFEDCGMFLSDKAPPKNGVPSNVQVDLERDFVNVMEIALFEMSIKTTDKLSGITPHIDLRMSINNVLIKTCSDTARAVVQLLTYYINDGDLNEETQQPESTQSNPSAAMEDELIKLEIEEHSLTKSQQDQISEMLVDAMRESPETSRTDETCELCGGAQLFYFPHEREALEEPSSSNVPQLIADLGDLKEAQFGGDNNDDFYIMGDDDMLPKSNAPEITWFSQDVRVIENYMAKPDSKRDVLAAPKSFPTPVTRYTLCDMSIVWQMFGGNDFKNNVKDNQKKEVRFADRQLSDSVSFSTKDRSQVRFNKTEDVRVKDMSWMQKGGVNRDQSVLLELKLSKVKFSHEVYPETSRQASRQVLSVFNVEIRDKLAQSKINKFLYQYASHDLPRQSHSNMVLIKALHSRPDPKVKQEECNLKISLMPIRLNIDQDSLFFLINFFKELSGESVDEPVSSSPKDGSLQSNTSSHHPPIMTTSLESEREIEQKAKEVITENLILLESRYHTDPDELKEPTTPGGPSNDSSPIYFRNVEFTKDVLIRLDYIAKRVDMSHGPIAGFLMGLTFLKCSEIRLKRIVHRHGLLGFNKLMEFLLQEWIADIKKNQLSTILGGIGPMKAVIQLFQGVWDLFWLPIQQYQKDGRIVRGLQRGANSFTTSTAMAALELTSRLIYFIQITAETAYDMLSPGPSLRTRRLAKRKERKKRYNQPQDIREGLTNACMVVKEGIGETVDNIMQVAALENEQKGISGAVGAVIRQIPPTIFKPVIIASDATHNLVSGLQSQLVPDVRKEANEKWRSDS